MSTTTREGHSVLAPAAPETPAVPDGGGGHGTLVLRDEVERALCADERAARRLGRAGTSVAFCVDGDRRASATLLLDRQPPEVVDGGEPAEVTIRLTQEEARCFVRGELVLPTAIFSGLVSCEGSARPYLAVDPILRGLLRAVRNGTDGAA